MAWNRYQFWKICMLLLLGFISSSIYAADNQQGCDKVLITQTISSTEDSSSELAWLHLISESNYEDAGRNAKAKYKSLFSGTYSDFNKKRREFFEQKQYKLSKSDSRNVYKSFLSDTQVESWRECMLRERVELFSYFKNIDDNGATLVVTWNVPIYVGRLKRIRKELSGGTSAQLSSLRSLQGERSFIIKRETLKESVRGVISGKAGVITTDFTTDFYLPKVPEPTPISGVSCIEYREGRANSVACNSKTTQGYYWRVGRKLKHYSVAGFRSTGVETPCDENNVGKVAQTGRFPYSHPFFQSVYTGYKNKATAMTHAQCQYVGIGNRIVKWTDTPVGYICGIFEAICTKQR